MKTDDQLLERLATDLRLAGKAERTVEAYTCAARRLARACAKPLAGIDEDDVGAYLVGLVREKVARGTFSINLCGVRFFFRTTLGHDWNIFDLARPKYGLFAPGCRERLTTARKILEHHLEAAGRPPRPRQVGEGEPLLRRRPRCPACGTPYRHPPRHFSGPRGPP